MKVREIMTTKLISIEPSASVNQAIRLMLQNRMSGLPVVQSDETLIGIITEGDFLRRAETATQKHRPRWLEFLIGPGRLADDYVQTCTHSNRRNDAGTVHCTEDASLGEVVNLMERYRIKRVPVVATKS